MSDFLLHLETAPEHEEKLLGLLRAVWSVTTELGPLSMCAGSIMRLDGADKELLRGLTALHGDYDTMDPDDIRSMNAWNAARQSLGHAPWPIPAGDDAPAGAGDPECSWSSMFPSKVGVSSYTG